MKDFDRWNKDKKILDAKIHGQTYRVRDIWWCAIGLNVGSEQDGKNEYFRRPVLIIKGISRELCLIAPLTTSDYEHPYRINIGSITGKKSKVILSQIKVIDTKRLITKIATLDKQTFELIKKSIRDML
jgi:mRNA interferase MazF